MKWNILSQNTDPTKVLETLLNNRGLTSKKDIDDFLNPIDPAFLAPSNVQIAKTALTKAITRVKKAIEVGEPIVVYGDYDADGICSSAILWETLKDLGAKAMPFIPHREKEGYGLSKEGIDSILSDEKYNLTPKSGGLIISVDSGIVAHDAVDYAKEKNLDVVILDHHDKPEKLPAAHAIVHTTSLCAAGISYIFSKEILATSHQQLAPSLELAAIATITDLMPLLGPNRSIVKYGLELLNKTPRPGLRALFNVAGIEHVGTYEVGFMIGPRLNASGRIENALFALRMLCTADFAKALDYAKQLNDTNRQRQEMTEEMTIHALQATSNQQQATERIIVIDHESYHQGIIGLVAGKLVDRYYLPAIVIARGEEVSKASARSISGFNIIEAIHSTEEMLLGAGGHPMAAGFSIKTSRIEEFKQAISKVALEKITDDLLDRVLRIDCKLELEQIDMPLFRQISQFEPFGLGNPEPTFATNVQVTNLRTVGQEGRHLKLSVKGLDQQLEFDCIAFGKGALCSQIKVGDSISIAYTIDLNTFNGRQSLQLKIKDIVLQSN